MQGQVCVVTGATSGIGKAAAAALARQGAEIIVVGRDPGRAEATAAAIQADGAPPPKVEIADLARLDQVRALAGRLNQTLDRIDVLINNAGLVLNERQVTPDGYEHVFAVNHLAPFLLTNLLRPKLTASAPGAGDHRVLGRAHRRPAGPRRPQPGARLEQLAVLLEQQAGQHPVHQGAGPPAGRHRRHRQLPAPRRRADRLRPGRPAADARRHHDRQAVHAVPGARRGHDRVPGQLTGRGREDRRVLRQAPAPRAVRGGPRRRPGPPALGDQRAPDRPGRRAQPSS